MGKRNYSTQGIKYWYAYDIDEICRLYSVHSRTVHKWIKNGLPTIDTKRPSLIYGYYLREFIKEMNTKGKCPTEFHEMFCMGCKEAKPIYKKRVTLEQKRETIRVKGQCRTCHSVMNKSYRLDDICKIRNVFEVGDVLPLYDSATPPLNAHLSHQVNMPTSESSQGDLFQ